MGGFTVGVRHNLGLKPESGGKNGRLLLKSCLFLAESNDNFQEAIPSFHPGEVMSDFG